MEKATQSSVAVEAKWGIPGAIGFLDGTHITIAAPKNDRQSYVDRNKNISIQAQVSILHRCQQSYNFIIIF